MCLLRTPPTGKFKIEFDLVPVSGFSKLSFVITMSHQFSKKHKISAITGKLDLDSDEEREVELHAQFISRSRSNISQRVYTDYTPPINNAAHTEIYTHPHVEVPVNKLPSNGAAEEGKRKQVCLLLAPHFVIG